MVGRVDIPGISVPTTARPGLVAGQLALREPRSILADRVPQATKKWLIEDSRGQTRRSDGFQQLTGGTRLKDTRRRGFRSPWRSFRILTENVSVPNVFDPATDAWES